ncbi:MAG TPA: patatin-like phospholipase family protein [Anaerolineales bacterium]|nr:patatin-like phospholipase family protein [Anaerolineales bacterium]
MAKKTALVLSGGGSKGAFQFMAEKYAREVKGYQWDIIAGVSVGALNGMLLAMKKYAQLEHLWRTITQDQIYTGKLNFWSILKIAFGAKSVYDNAPLRHLIEREYQPEMIDCNFRIGAVSLSDGWYRMFTPADEGFREAILASTAIPLVWEPVNISPQYQDMVDGGVRNISPLGDVLDFEPDEVVIIHCDPPEPPIHDQPFENAIDIGLRTVEVMMLEILVTDIREFIRINKNVKEAEAGNIILHNENGKPYKYFDYKLIEPDEPLGDMLDFSRQLLDMRMQAGWEKARQVLGD